MECKIESSRSILKRHGFDPEDYGSVRLMEMIEEAQRHAIEASVKVVADFVIDDYYPEVIISLMDSPMLKVPR